MADPAAHLLICQYCQHWGTSIATVTAMTHLNFPFHSHSTHTAHTRSRLQGTCSIHVEHVEHSVPVAEPRCWGGSQAAGRWGKHYTWSLLAPASDDLEVLLSGAVRHVADNARTITMDLMNFSYPSRGGVRPLSSESYDCQQVRIRGLV
mmetsp:Transcript_36632/g.81529  ORF Transcript_36632/g.81529 Transcript_36632/m.81529 type:complete len:149 (-) Transcript_36632:58-504(-)